MMKLELLIPTQNDNNTVVIYFLRTNNTKKIANYIIDTLLESKRFSASVTESEVEEWINELNIIKNPMEEY